MDRATLHRWQNHRIAGHADVEAVLGALGYRMVLQHMETGKIVTPDASAEEVQTQIEELNTP